MRSIRVLRSQPASPQLHESGVFSSIQLPCEAELPFRRSEATYYLSTKRARFRQRMDFCRELNGTGAMEISDKRVPKGFADPTALPAGPDEQRLWQEANRSWWQRHPMRYDWRDRVDHPEFSK